MSNTNGFSQNAEMYATSPAHAETGDLDLALAVLGDVDGLDLLDVATGTGHTAFFFAERHAHVFAVDINDEMLSVAQEMADQKSYSCRFLKGFANDLPFDDHVFDVVTTRLAAHHFDSPSDFLAESHRVLRKGGRIVIIDNVVPEDDVEAGEWINAYEKKRDPSHEACLSQSAWRGLLAGHGFVEPVLQDYPKTLDFDLWMQRMSIVDADAEKLWSQLQSAPESVARWLKPEAGKQRSFTLHRMVAVAQKK